MPTIRLLRASLLVVAAGAAAAASDGFIDLRVGDTFAKVSYDETIHGSTDENIRQNWNERYRLWAELLGSPGMDATGGWLIGFDLTNESRNKHQGDPDNIELKYEAWAAHVDLGYGFLWRPFELEFVPFGGLGISEARRQGGDRSSDALIEYGGNINAFFLLKRFEIGVQGGYLRAESESKVRDEAGNRVSYRFKDGSFTYGVFIGARF